MSHKKRKTSANQSVISSIEKLNFPLKNNIGNNVFLKRINSKHDRSNHIAKQYHGLNGDDIKLIPEILKNPVYVTKDPNHKEKKNYYGRRLKSHKILFIKIVTKVQSHDCEEIITVFTTNHIKH